MRASVRLAAQVPSLNEPVDGSPPCRLIRRVLAHYLFDSGRDQRTDRRPPLRRDVLAFRIVLAGTFSVMFVFTELL